MGVQRTIIRPHPRDNQLSPIPIDFDPDTLGWLLDEGGRGNLMLQNELFNTMEETWDRLRGNLNKYKKAVCKLPFNLQPWTDIFRIPKKRRGSPGRRSGHPTSGAPTGRPISCSDSRRPMHSF